MLSYSTRLCAKSLPRRLARPFSSNSTDKGDPSSIDWNGLGFGYVPTDCTVITEHKNGEWSHDIRRQEPYVRLHVLSNVIHYGQALFEGLKAFRHKDGRVAIFNPKENANRMRYGAARMAMPDVPEELFLKICEEVVAANAAYIPPYGTGGALYLRPFYFGAGAKLGLGRATEYVLGAISSPVGLYYPTGLKPIDALIVEGYHRAAPEGVGAAKTAGNYAADILPAEASVEKGYPISLYLDAKEDKYIEEFSSSNFVAISKDRSTYVTPESSSVLRSITNIMLKDLAREKGLKVEERKITFDDIKNGDFSEVAACGTAVIVTPIKSITKGSETVQISENLDILEDLYNDIRGLQVGEKEDKLGWNHYVDC